MLKSSTELGLKYLAFFSDCPIKVLFLVVAAPSKKRRAVCGLLCAKLSELFGLA